MTINLELGDLLICVITLSCGFFAGFWALFRQMVVKPLDRIWRLLGAQKTEQSEHAKEIAVLQTKVEHIEGVL